MHLLGYQGTIIFSYTLYYIDKKQIIFQQKNIISGKKKLNN